MLRLWVILALERLDFTGSFFFKRFQDNFDAAVFLVLERFIRFGRHVERQNVRDEERRIDFALLNRFEQTRQIALDVRLSHLESQAFGESRATRLLLLSCANCCNVNTVNEGVSSLKDIKKRIKYSMRFFVNPFPWSNTSLLGTEDCVIRLFWNSFLYPSVSLREAFAHYQVVSHA